MENLNPAQTTPPPPPRPTEVPIPYLYPHPSNAAQTLPPQPFPPPTLPQESKKRPLDQNGHVHDSTYFKMRAVIKDLRPHFIEVLRTPAFHNCKAAHEIREKMKVLMDLYRETTEGKNSIGKCKNVSECDRGVKPVVQPPASDTVFVKASSEEKPVLLATVSEKQTPQGTYIVGGSAFGWNFITYLGNKPVYCGRTKEMFRSANVILPH